MQSSDFKVTVSTVDLLSVGNQPPTSFTLKLVSKFDISFKNGLSAKQILLTNSEQLVMQSSFWIHERYLKNI